MGKGKGMGKCKLKGKNKKQEKHRKVQRKPKTRVKDNYVKRAKNRLKAIKRDNNNGMDEGKQEQNKGDIRTMT